MGKWLSHHTLFQSLSHLTCPPELRGPPASPCLHLDYQNAWISRSSAGDIHRGHKQMVNRYVLPLQSHQVLIPLPSTAPWSQWRPWRMEALGNGNSYPHIQKSIAQASNSKWEICISRWKSWWAHSHLKLLFYPLFFLTCLLVLSSFKGLALSTIPNAHMEANKYALLVPSYESSNVKVTWQIFSIPNVKTTMDFPEGAAFQKLCEIRLAGQERRNAATTHIPWKTPVNGILTVQTVTLGNTPS